MKNKVYSLMFLAVVLFMVSIAPQALADEQSAQSKEYQIKAAFVYNFIKFVDWPEDKIADSDDAITIGIIGSKDFIEVFEPLKGKKIKDRNISIKYFAGFEKLKKSQDADDPKWNEEIEKLKTCHVLMFCIRDSTQIENSPQIIKALQDLPVLTVGEEPGFLEAGGMINFVMDKAKVRFEINNSAAKRADLKIRSQLLKLAKRVVEKDGVEDNNTESSEGTGN